MRCPVCASLLTRSDPPYMRCSAYEPGHFWRAPKGLRMYEWFGMVHCHPEVEWADRNSDVTKRKVVGAAGLETATSCV